MQPNNERLKALKISALAITSVVLVEFTLGFVVGSLAILSDGAHALLDAISMFILLVATKVSLKPSDEEHMYGHEKIESLGGLVGGLILFATALIIIARAFQRIIQGESLIVPSLEVFGFMAIAYTLCVDVLRVGVLHRASGESTTVKAGFYHSVADLGSTLVALFGFGMATFGFPIFDALASLVLSGAIGYLSIKLVKASGMELSDAAPKQIIEKVREIIAATENVSNVASLKVRKAGAKTFVEASIQVPDYMNLKAAHEVASRVEENLKQFLGEAHVSIHVEPLETEMLTEELVEKIAREIDGVKDVHEVNVVYAHGKLYVTLHARVDPKLSVNEAHELAEKIEHNLNQKIPKIGNVTVHVEPFNSDVQKGPMADEEEIQQTIYELAERFQQSITVKRVITCVADGKRYVNIDCCIAGQASIEEAHKVASKIENGVRRRFAKTVVTVHVEPE
ncbi:MAG: cation diffusion facilitator family transporter [Candidatus Bathyarchaeia archaeon]